MTMDFDRLYTARRRTAQIMSVPFERPPALPDGPSGQVHCATASLDARGRLSERTAIRALGWLAGQPIKIDARDCVAVVTKTVSSRWSIGPRGYLHLPAAIRHACILRAGDRVLLLALPERSLLLAIPTPIAATAIREHRPDLWPGE